MSRNAASMPYLSCLILLVGLTVTTACGDVTIRSTPPSEGDAAGECSDGADNDGNGLFDCEDPACAGSPDCQVNQPPAGHAVRIDPASPGTADDLLCVVETAASDPEGDPVSYSYAWLVDGEDAGIQEAALSSELTEKGQVWTCQVVAFDDFAEGPFASALTTIGNTAPTVPDVIITPGAPELTDDLICEVQTPSDDIDGDNVTYEFEWILDGNIMATGEILPWTLTSPWDIWACTATPTDGTDYGPSDEASAEVSLPFWASVTTGRRHSCGVAPDSTWSCWGIDDSSANDFGQLATPFVGTPLVITAGRNHTCITSPSEGLTPCYGDNSQNQLQAPGDPFFTMSAGYDHTCGILYNGEVRCWGSTTWWSSSPPSTPARQITSGDEYSCAILDGGTLECWWGTSVGFSTPSGEFIQVDGGGAHLCGIRDGDIPFCVGEDGWGQVSGIPSGITFSKLSAGDRHSCGIDANDGTVHCWGDDSQGQTSGVPAGSFIDVSAGWSQTCGARDNGTFECWGCANDDQGQCSVIAP